jgi:hypothetical protein
VTITTIGWALAITGTIGRVVKEWRKATGQRVGLAALGPDRRQPCRSRLLVRRVSMRRA